MRSLDEINEKLYIDISRLHRYEEFMDAKKAEEVANNIFEDYKQEVEIYKEQKKLQREKILYEVRALTRALKPRAFFGLFKSRTAKLSNAQLAEIEKEYCDIYMPSREVYETLNAGAEEEQAETEMAEAEEIGAAEPETEVMEQSEPTTEPTESAEAPAPEAVEPTEENPTKPAEPAEEEEVIFDDGEDEEEADEPREPTDKPADKPDEDDGDGDGDGEEEETSEEGEHGEVSEPGKSEQGIFRHENVCDLQDL